MNLCDTESLWFNRTNWALQFFMIKALCGTLASIIFNYRTKFFYFNKHLWVRTQVNQLLITIYIWIHQNLITLCLDSLVETNNALGKRTNSMLSLHKTIKIYHFHITIKIYLVLFSLIQLLDLLKLSFVLLISMEMLRNDRRLRRMDNRGNNVPVRSEVFYDQLVIESQVHLGLKTWWIKMRWYWQFPWP